MERKIGNDIGDLLIVLLVVFLVLKLTHLIYWSWWWVLSPLWIPIGLYVVVLFVMLVIDTIMRIIAAIKGE